MTFSCFIHTISAFYYLGGPWWLPRQDEFILPTSASCSRKLDHSSASVSLLEAPLSMNSVARFGVLGVRRGVPGTRSFPGILEVPGRARPACSRCSVLNTSDGLQKFFVCKFQYSPSFQPRSAAISCNIWNFFGSDRSKARKCRKWLVTICLNMKSACN
jgi:hypothetical protein